MKDDLFISIVKRMIHYQSITQSDCLLSNRWIKILIIECLKRSI